MTYNMTCHKNNDYLCENKLLCHMDKSSISGKLKSALIKKYGLISEKQVTEKIELAIRSFYDISEDEIIINSGDVAYDAYIYLYLNPIKRGKWHIYGDTYVNNMPMYVGKGRHDRSESHLKYADNKQLDESIKNIRKHGFEPIIKIFNSGCTSEMAFNLENYIIARLREQGVDICNSTNQQISQKYSRHIDIRELNLETAKNILILDAMNSCKTYRESSELLGISERTLYRNVKGLNIIKVGGVYVFADKMAYSVTEKPDGTEVEDNRT